MKNSNIIISVIIVLVIAGGVSAYGLLNPESNILNLPGFTSDDSDSDNGDSGQNTGKMNNGSGTGSSDSDSGSNSGGSGSGSNVGSSNSGSNSGNSGGSGGSSSGSNSESKISSAEAAEIANNAIEEDGCYAGSPKWDKSSKMWIVKVYDQDGKDVDSIGVNNKGKTSRE